MVNLQVLFDLPAEIGRALDSGEMSRRGGVIQWAKGDHKGKVVMWLKESGDLVRHASRRAFTLRSCGGSSIG